MSVKTGSATLITEESTVSRVPTVNATTTASVLSHEARLSRETRSLRRADALIAAGQTEKALTHLRRLMREMPGAIRVRLKVASLLKEARRIGEALSVLRAAVSQAPDDPAPHEALAELTLELGEWEEAIQHGRELLLLTPRSLTARDILSAAYMQRGMLPDALRMAEELVRLEPGEPVHHFKRGVLLQQMGQVSAACDAFLRVLRDGDDEGDDLLVEAKEALEMLENFQLRQIALLAMEDIPFRLHLRRDPIGTIRAKGFRLSSSGISALMRLAMEELPQPSPGWRHHYYH